jgi:predicted GNAT family acetyltransferase
MVDGYEMTTDSARIDVGTVHGWLSSAYWAVGRPLDVMTRAIQNSRSWSVFAGPEQVAYARVVTDNATFAWLADVYVADEHRGRGLGGWLTETIVAALRAEGMPRVMLATRDAHEVYRRQGFTELALPERFMEIDNRPSR